VVIFKFAVIVVLLWCLGAGGVLLALIEGVGIVITRWSADQFKMGM